MGAGQTRIVILGGGFAGISTALELERLTKSDPSLEVHLVSNENYFVFQPLLPEVVSCGIEPSHILNPIRQLCKRVHVHCASVEGIDIDKQLVTVVGGDARRVYTLPYDHLILCLGLRMDLSRVPGMAEHALPIKTLGDAFHLRNHVLNRLEEADLESDEALRRKALTFVAVGGGFSGVETVAEINDMIKGVLPFYPNAGQTGFRMILIHDGARLLQELDTGLSEFAQLKLQQRGVEIVLNSRVVEATAEGVVLSNGERIATSTVIGTVGNAPHPLVVKLSLPQDRGRLLADEYLSVRGYKNIWALGDSTLVPDVKRGGFCPPTAQYATRQGRHCAQNILAAIRGAPLQPFQFRGLGQLVMVGRRCGVAQILGWKISGIIAWMVWRTIYLMKLPGLRCKIRVAIDWGLELLFPRDITKIEVQRTESLSHAHFGQGEVIIRQGEIGDRFYIIESGEVEVLSDAPGKPPERLRVCSAGDTFGEVALLKKAPRTATVRCLTPVDVVAFSRKDFLKFFKVSGLFRAHMQEELDRLLPRPWPERRPES